MTVTTYGGSDKHLDPDAIFGSGNDGDQTLVGNYTLTRDFNCKNLTVPAGLTLNTNGFRLFVRGALNLDGVIGLPGGFAGAGTVAGGGAAGQAVTHSLGGSSASQTATPPAANKGGPQYFTHPWHAVDAYTLHAGQTTPLMLRGGAGGTGPGGGIVVVAAQRIYGTGVIRANATGGDGGVVILITEYSVPNGITYDVSGDNPGTRLLFLPSGLVVA